MGFVRNFLLTVFVFSLAACSGSGGGNNNIPNNNNSNGGNTSANQTEANKAVETLATIGIQNADFIAGFANCAQVNGGAFVVNQVQTSPCEAGGDSSSIINKLECQDGPPFTFSVEDKTDVTNCKGNATLSKTGTYHTKNTRNNSTVSVVISADAFNIDGMEYTFDDFTVQQNTPGTNTCRGTLKGQGFSCTVNADCKTCTLAP